MTTVPPTQPPAAPEGEVRLTEAERDYFCGNLRQNLGYRAFVIEDTMLRHVERIVAERLRVVEGERDAPMRATWAAYVESGADTDGDEEWHCTPEWAGKSLVHAVETLRKDYDDSLDESTAAEARAESAEAALAELRETLDTIVATLESGSSVKYATLVDARALLGGAS